jgi:hypothetical protein
MKVAQEDIDKVVSQEDVKSILDGPVKHQYPTAKERQAFKFGVTSATGAIDEMVDQLAILYGMYNFDDDDVKLLTRTADKKLLRDVV